MKNFFKFIKILFLVFLLNLEEVVLFSLILGHSKRCSPKKVSNENNIIKEVPDDTNFDARKRHKMGGGWGGGADFRKFGWGAVTPGGAVGVL